MNKQKLSYYFEIAMNRSWRNPTFKMRLCLICVEKKD